MQQSIHSGSGERATLAGKYLTFRLGLEEYGIEILRVREIIGLMDVTPVPRSAEHVRGVINLRGRIIPVFDLRTKFRMEPFVAMKESCIIVLDIPADDVINQMGVLVDGVSEVVDIASEDIDPPPPLRGDLRDHYFLGLAKSKTSVKMLLNTERILNGNDSTAALDETIEC